MVTKAAHVGQICPHAAKWLSSCKNNAPQMSHAAQAGHLVQMNILVSVLKCWVMWWKKTKTKQDAWGHILSELTYAGSPHCWENEQNPENSDSVYCCQLTWNLVARWSRCSNSRSHAIWDGADLTGMAQPAPWIGTRHLDHFASLFLIWSGFSCIYWRRLVGHILKVVKTGVTTIWAQ